MLVFWEQGQGVRVMVHTLGRRRRPARAAFRAPEVRQRGSMRRPSQELKRGLDALFADGRPFSQLLKTAVGGYVEADGRAAGGRAILRLREVTGRKRDLSRILDQHRLLVRNTQSGRALLNSLPMPVWFRRDDGRIEWVNEAYVKAVEATGESRGARAPDRAAGNAPARRGQGCAGQGRALSRARAHHQRRRAQGARRGGAAARWRDGRGRHRRRRAGDGAGRAEPPRGRLRAHAGSRGHGGRHLRSRPAPRVLQRGLSQAVAVRRRLAGDQAHRCAAARPAARAVAPARGRQLPRLEGQNPLGLQDRHRVRGLVASARWPHHPRRVLAAPRRRPHLSLRRRHRALRAREPLQRPHRCAARDARRPEGRRGGVRDRRTPQAAQLGAGADLAPLAQHAARGPAHRRDHQPVRHPLRRLGNMGAHQPIGHGHLRPAPADRGPDDEARSERRSTLPSRRCPTGRR